MKKMLSLTEINACIKTVLLQYILALIASRSIDYCSSELLYYTVCVYIVRCNFLIYKYILKKR